MALYQSSRVSPCMRWRVHILFAAVFQFHACSQAPRSLDEGLSPHGRDVQQYVSSDFSNSCRHRKSLEIEQCYRRRWYKWILVERGKFRSEIRDEISKLRLLRDGKCVRILTARTRTAERQESAITIMRVPKLVQAYRQIISVVANGTGHIQGLLMPWNVRCLGNR